MRAMSIIGSRAPRLSSVPDGDDDRGDQAVAFARWAGLTLFPWQEDVLRQMCRIGDDGLWVAPESVIIVPRQNGKGEILVARELAGIFLFGEESILHTAHFLDTAVDARDRLWDVIENNDDLFYWWEDDPDTPGVPSLVRTNGKEAIEFPNGAKVRFRTRTEKTGRGSSFELVVFDECFNLPNQVHAAISKTTRARKNAQKIYISSPVNRFEHSHGYVFSAKRWAGMDGADGIMFLEWSADLEQVDMFSDEALIQANPSLTKDGIYGAQYADARGDAEAAKRSESLRDEYLVETLGVGNWVPRDDSDDREYVFDPEVWSAAAVEEPVVVGDSCIGVDVTPSGDRVAIVSAQRTLNGAHLSIAPVVEFDREVVSGMIVNAVNDNDPLGIVLDSKGPSSTVVKPLSNEGIDAVELSWKQVTAATELLVQMVAEGKITHDGDQRFIDALDAAAFRPGHTGRAFARVGSGSVCELVAASFAIWGLVEFEIPDVVENLKVKHRFTGHAEVIRVESPAAVMAF